MYTDNIDQKIIEAIEKKNSSLLCKITFLCEAKGLLTHFPHLNKNIKVLYTYGIGSSVFQESALKWLCQDKERKLIVILSSIQRINNLNIHFIKHPQLYLGSCAKEFIWDNIFLPWHAVGCCTKELKNLKEISMGVELVCGLNKKYGFPYLKNISSNIEHSKKIFRGSDLYGKFTGIPAIICGAGISLAKHFNELRALNNSALILSGGSALTPLSLENVHVHLVAAVDPDPPKERFIKHSFRGQPIFFQNQVSSELLKHHSGQKMCIGESGSFPLEQFLIEDLQLEPINAGWNVATFATSIAYLLGCRTIYLVGVDLCGGPKSSYVNGVIGEDDRCNDIKVYDVDGNKKATRKDFLMAKNWFEHFLQKHPDLRLINTSRGIKIEGVEYSPLPLMPRKSQLQAMIHKAVCSAAEMNLSQSRLKLSKLKGSIKELAELLDKCILKLSFQRSIVAEEALLGENELFNLYLKSQWNIWKYIILRETKKHLQDQPNCKKIHEILFYKNVLEYFKNHI